MADGLWRQHQQAAGYLAATRLKSAFEVLGSFIAYLTACLGEEEGGPGPTITSIMSPDLLLKLRSAILETMFLTVECPARLVGRLPLLPIRRWPGARSTSSSISRLCSRT